MDAGASFEKELGNLEKVVALLERGDLGLDDAIRQFESGHRSLDFCRRALEEARRRIEILAGPGPAVSGGPAESGQAGPASSIGSAEWRPLDFPGGSSQEDPDGSCQGTSG